MSEAPQRQAGVSLQAFATQEGITKSQALYLANRGRIMGAQKTHGGGWLVFPPAKLTEPLRKRTTWRDREAAESAPAALAFGTSPHGLAIVDRSAAGDGVSAHRQQVQGGSHAHSTGEASDTSGMETPEQGAPNCSASGLHPIANWRCRAGGFAFEVGEEVDALSSTRGANLPAIFTSPKVLESVRSARLAGSQLFYPVVLSGAQLLIIERALGHEVETIKDRAELHEFDLAADEFAGHELETVEAVLRVLKQATSDRHRANGHELRAEVSL